MYKLYTLSNPDLRKQVLHGRHLRSQAMAASAYHAVLGIEALGRGLYRAAALAVSHIARWRKRRKSVAVLQGLSNSMLRDVGISRGEIYSVVLALEAAESKDSTAAEIAEGIAGERRHSAPARNPGANDNAAPRQPVLAPPLQVAGCG